MKCPDCVKNNQTSKVYPDWRNNVKCKPAVFRIPNDFYDEEGTWHHHGFGQYDENSYHCSNGHSFKNIIDIPATCWCGWSSKQS